MAQLLAIRRFYPTRYWLLVAYGVGVPGFIKFDVTGRTHVFGLFNPYSISVVAFTLSCAAAFFAITFTSNTAVLQRKIRFHNSLWIALILVLVAATFANPKYNILLGLYRMFECFLLYLLLASAYTREPRESSTRLLRDLTMKVVNISIAFVLIGLVVYPSLAYTSPSESTGILENRLGGFIVYPNTLGLLAAVGLLHSLLYLKGGKRIRLIAFYGLILLFTVSRGNWVGLAIALIIYVVATPSKRTKAFGIIGLLAGVATSALFSQTILRVIERGNGEKGLKTLSDRTSVWITAWRAFRMRPWVGYGYVDGVKRILAQLYPFSYWTPPHCHNEILQALLSGGILCAVLVLIIYFVALFGFFRHLSRNPGNSDVLFFSLVFVLIVVHSVLGPILTGARTQISLLLLVCCVACFDALPMGAHSRSNKQWESTEMARAGA